MFCHQGMLREEELCGLASILPEGLIPLAGLQEWHCLLEVVAKPDWRALV